MQIEEQKRSVEILNQEIENEVWRACGDAGGNSQSVTSAALVLDNADEGNSSDGDDETKSLTLSVSSCKTITPSSENTFIEEDSTADVVELERARTEMEANLYLGLRLSTELEEADKLMTNSQQLLQVRIVSCNYFVFVVFFHQPQQHDACCR